MTVASLLALVPPDLLGTIPGWITSGAVVTLLIAILRRDVLIKGQVAQKEEDIRDHYSVELAALRAQRAEDQRIHALEREEDRKRWKEALDHSEEQHKICNDDRDKLRGRLRNVEDKLEGLYRTMIATNAEGVIRLGDTIPEHVREVAQKTLNAQRQKP